MQWTNQLANIPDQSENEKFCNFGHLGGVWCDNENNNNNGDVRGITMPIAGGIVKMSNWQLYNSIRIYKSLPKTDKLFNVYSRYPTAVTVPNVV